MLKKHYTTVRSICHLEVALGYGLMTLTMGQKCGGPYGPDRLDLIGIVLA